MSFWTTVLAVMLGVFLYKLVVFPILIVAKLLLKLVE